MKDSRWENCEWDDSEWKKKIWDKRIQDALKREAQTVGTEPMEKERIRRAVLRNCKEEKPMKKNWRKVVCAVAVMCALCAGGVFAGGKITTLVGGSSPVNDVLVYDQMPKEMKKLGYEAKMTETFSNGYTFKNAQVMTVNGMDDDGNTVATYPELMAHYEKAGEARLSYTVCKPLENAYEGEKMDLDGLNAYYKVDHYRFVPVGYEISEEEKALMDSGELYMSYGSEKVEDKTVKSFSWEENGIRYSFMIMDETSMEAADFMQMAREVIAEK